MSARESRRPSSREQLPVDVAPTTPRSSGSAAQQAGRLASTLPTAPAARPRTATSIRSCVARRPRSAPSAARSASSPDRLSTWPIMSAGCVRAGDEQNDGHPRKCREERRTDLLTDRSRIEVRVAFVLSHCGTYVNCAASRRVIWSTAGCILSTRCPGATRPTIRCRNWLSIQRLGDPHRWSGKAKFFGMTPIRCATRRRA